MKQSKSYSIICLKTHLGVVIMNIVPKPKIISHKTLEIRINQEQIIDASKRLQKKIEAVNNRLAKSVIDSRTQFFK